MQNKTLDSHIQLLDPRRLMWCDKANTVIQETLGDRIDFNMYGGVDEGLGSGQWTQQTFVARSFCHDVSRSVEIVHFLARLVDVEGDNR